MNILRLYIEYKHQKQNALINKRLRYKSDKNLILII